MDRSTRTGVIRFVIREYFGVVSVVLLLCGISGKWDWTGAWVLAAMYFVWVSATIAAVAPRSPELLAERTKRIHPNQKGWDKVILMLFGTETIGRYVVAALDQRWGWTQGFPLALQVVGGLVAALGFALVTWSMASNAWFAMVVRTQEDRGQRVATGGPYRWVRHPGYLGTCGMEVGSALLLASWGAVGIGVAGAILMIVRTRLEDRTLHEELPGYPEFAARTRWRLVPGVW